VSVGPTLPPQDLDAEVSLLGALLLSEVAVDQATEIVRIDDFYREAHGRVFEAITRIYKVNGEVDAITVANELTEMGKLDEVGGTAFVQSLADAVPAVAHARRYAEIVHDLAIIRRLIAAGLEIAQAGYERTGTASDLVDLAESRIFDVAQERAREGLMPIRGLLQEEFERLDKLNEAGSEIVGVPSGLRELDRVLSGFQPSNLIVLAARPGMGKTSLALGFARHIAVDEGLPVAIFSLEMSRHEVTQRLLSAQALVDSNLLKNPRKMRQEDWSRVTQAAEKLSRAPVYIDDSAGITVMEIRSKSRRLMAQERSLSLVVVDYLQLMSSGERSVENRVQEISQISRGLKLLARDLSVPVVALSQLNRSVESRQDKRPLLSDLRESGSIEQDSDVVMFIYREEYYERIAKEGAGGGRGQPAPESSESKRGIAELIVAKHRSGAIDNVEVAFREKYTRFDNVVRGDL
jgi:replicative DNA helicase